MRAIRVLQPRGIIDEATGRFEIGRHFGELELNRLITIDRLSELLPLAGIADGLFKCPATATERQRAGDDADLGQKLAQVRLAVAFGSAQSMAVGNEAVVE